MTLKKISFFVKIKNFLYFIIFFVYKYIFGIKEEKKLVFKIFFLLLLSHIFCLFIHSIMHGLVNKVTSDLSQGYGDIYFQFKEKLFLKEFEKKKIIERIKKNNDVESFFAYGTSEGMLLIEEQYIPVLVLTFLFDKQDSVFSYKQFSKFDFTKKSLYLGFSLFNKIAQVKDKIKLAVINEHDKKNNCLFYDIMPIKNLERAVFSWDEWNDKALIFNIVNFENYFEAPTIFGINIYLKRLSDQYRVCDFLKAEFSNEVGFISLSQDIFPEHQKYLKLIRFISYFILYLIVIFSMTILSILIELYVLKNTIQYLYLRMLGLKKYFLIVASTIFFLVINISALGLATGVFFIIRKGLYYFDLLLVDELTETFLNLDISFHFYFFYLLSSFFLNFFVSFYSLNKNIK